MMVEDTMRRRKASNFFAGHLDLFGSYSGAISRRTFLRGTQKFAGGATAAALCDMMRRTQAWAQQVPENDRRIRSDYAYLASPQGHGMFNAYLAYRNTSGTRPGVLVVHENRGLSPYVEDVTRRLALEGFIALAPDGLSSVGGYPDDDEKGAELFKKVDLRKMREDFRAAAIWLKTSPSCTGKIGIVGFGFGGGMANQLAVEMGSDLAVTVSFYGAQPGAADAGRIKTPVLAHYAELDTQLTAGWPAFDAALSAAHVPRQGHIYSGASEGFHNDTTPRYDQAAAKLAWQRTLDWLNKYLSG
jgi:carboxymethylenebutenolidase